MSSYYNQVHGNLIERRIARVEDINLIQKNIQKAIEDMINDLHGPHFIIGEEEEALQLVPTTDVTDQCNYNYDSTDESKQWISFYDRYFRQPIYITKSSIESITVHIENKTNITTTIYAEIRDTDFDLVAESSVVLEPTVNREDENSKYNVTFNFNKDHLPVGHYYFVIRPVDISAADLTENGDESVYDYIAPEDSFNIRYDVDGTYHKSLNDVITNSDDYEQTVSVTQGLEASYDGSNYLDAIKLPELYSPDASGDYNIDLYFEETYSSGLTFLVKPGAAIVFGEKVESFDTHVKINEPSSSGDRTDLVILRNNGKLEVIQGSEYNADEKKYPDSNDGLKLAYITVYQNNAKPVLIEQDDENGMTRHRDLLERVRRLEKKLDYQVTNNSPSRIKYNCGVDPIMFNDGLSKNIYDKEKQVFEEGSYGVGLDLNDDGQNIIKNTETLTYMWSIIKAIHNYSHETTVKTEGYCRVFNVDTLNNQGTPKEVTDGLYKAKVSTNKITSTDPSKALQHPIKGVTVKVVIKSGKTQKYTKTTTTNSKGEATLNLNKAKLPSGKTYTVYTTVGNKTITTTFKVHKSQYKVSNPGSKGQAITITDREKVTEKKDIRNDGIIFGNDYFETSNMTIDTKKGIIELAKTDVSKDKYTKNKPLSTDKKSKLYYNSDIHEYKVYSNKDNLKSEFPVLHLSFDRDTHIKSITPYIKTFKNIASLGILLFKNDQVLNIKSHKRKLVEKKFKKDPVYPNIFQASKKITGASKGKDGKQTISSNITFKSDIKLEAGTYTLVIYGKLQNGKSEGALYLREFDTHGNLDTYGMSAKSTGSSNLSLLKMHTNNLTSRSWNVVFEQRPDKYVETGVVSSTAKNVGKQINSCSIRKNIVDNNGTYKLEVSNNGGANWVDATSLKNGKTIRFNGTGTVLKWRLTFNGDGKHTPQLFYSEKKKYAIKFTLNVEESYVPYEDFRRCYETPIFNANMITRTYLIDPHIKNSFNEWEFARIFMLDDDNSSNVDICFSYDYDDYTTNTQTYKNDWKSNVFFSTIFADLKLSDFNTNSVDYDNYDANVEFDEHNFPFRLESESMMHNSAGINIASPSSKQIDKDVPYEYGNINNEDDRKKISDLFTYEYVEHEYTYYMNDDIESQKHSGAHILEGPYYSAKFLSSDPTMQKESLDKVDKDIYPNIKKYIINGISFNNALHLDENNANLTLFVYVEPGITSFTETELNEDGTPKTDTSGNEITNTTPRQTVFPSGTFSIVVSLADDGTISESDDADPNDTIVTPTGIAIPITQELGFDIITEDDGTIKGVGKFNGIEMELSEYIDQFSSSGIRSIGIRVNKPENIHQNDVIGLGLLNGGYYNRRPYVAYTYTGLWDRFKWKRLSNNARFYNIVGGKGSSEIDEIDGKYFKFFYPTYRDEKVLEDESDNLADIDEEGGYGYAHKTYGTSMFLERDNVGAEIDDNDISTRGRYHVTSIKRKSNNITANIMRQYKDTNTPPTPGTISTTNSGNELLFIFPANETGNIFKIDTNIPFSLYDLIDIEYYIYSDNVLNEKDNVETVRESTNTPTYKCDGDSQFHTYHYYGNFSKGDILFKLYDKVDIDDAEPIETFTLPSWGRIQQNATIKDKSVSAWFKKRSNASRVKSIVIERANPNNKEVGEIRLVLKNMLFYNADTMPALGPQMLMRIYPESDLNEIQIRKTGCIYRI